MSLTSERSDWAGDVMLWEDHGLFIGRAGAAEMHESPAIKLCIALDGRFRLMSGSDGCSQEYDAAAIPAGFSHSIAGDGCEMAMILLAPEGELGRAFAGAAAADEIVSVDEIAGRLLTVFTDFSADPDEQKADDAVRDAVSLIVAYPPFDRPQEMDPRVVQSIEWIRAGRESGILVRDIAAEVDLSESRFSHLFSEHLRVPVRRYLLWLRLRDVLHMLATAGNLTEAAHSAGFSDSAHLSRTFRSALGIAPSELIRHSRVTSFLR